MSEAAPHPDEKKLNSIRMRINVDKIRLEHALRIRTRKER